jgi:hypothetical protein
VKPASVGKAGLDEGLRFVDPQAQRPNHPLDQVEYLGVGLQGDPRPLDPPLPLDVHLAGGVDHHLGDPGVPQQLLDRTKADHLIRYLADQAGHLRARDYDPVLLQDPPDRFSEVQPLVGLTPLEQGRIPFVQQPLANPLLQIDAAVLL